MQRLFIVCALIAGFCASAIAGPDLTSARIYRNQGDYAKAAEFFTKELEKSPDSWVVVYERGELYGKIAMDRTKKGVMRDLVGEPEDPQYDMLKLMMADFDRVLASDEKRARKNHDDIKEILEGYWGKFYNQAVTQDTLHQRTIDGELTLDPDSLLGKMYQTIDKALLVSPGEWNTYALKGQAMDRAGMINESNEIWVKAKEGLEATDLEKKEPNQFFNSWIVIQLHRLQNHYNLEEFEQAIQVADEIEERDEGNQNAKIFKAYSLTRIAGDADAESENIGTLREQAMAALQEAREAAPEDETILYYLGQFAEQGGDTAQALEWYQGFLEMEPADTDVLFVVGFLYLQGGSYIDLSKAEEHFQKIVDHDESLCAAWTNLGIAQVRQDKTKIGSDNMKRGKDCSEAESGN